MSQWLPPGQYPPASQPPYSSYQGPPTGPSNQYIPAIRPPPYQRPPLNSTNSPSNDELSASYDNLAVSLRGTAGPGELDSFQRSLSLLMHDCSQSNIQRGKTWIFDHCTNPSQFEVLARFIISLSKSRPLFEDKLHLIYLINDVLFHSERRQEPWIKEALHPHLHHLLRAAYHFLDATENQQEKVLKVISIWGDKHYFDEAKINNLKASVLIPPPPPGQPPTSNFSVSQPLAPPPPPPPPGPIITSNLLPSHIRPISEPGPPGISSQFPPPGTSPPPPPSSIPIQGMIPRPAIPPPPAIPPVPEKKYHELPAGLMVPAVSAENPPYTPIPVASIRIPPHRLPPTPELLDALDKFYEGLKLIVPSPDEENKESSVTPKEIIELDKDGWEKGFLDNFYKDLQMRRATAAAKAVSERHRIRKNEEEDGQEIEVIQDLNQYQGLLHEIVQGELEEDIVIQTRQEVEVEVDHEFMEDIESEAEVEIVLDQALGIGIEVVAVQGIPEVIVVTDVSLANIAPHLDDVDVVGDEIARPDRMISDRNVGFQMLKKLGWEGAGTGLGSSSTGIAEPIKGGEVRHGEQKYLGVGHDRGEGDDIFDQYRKQKSYTYQRIDAPSKDKPAGCFRCGKPGHIARECHAIGPFH
ncbi:10961_t:CDS:10 [Ambispora gerdemannii]|uniref:10961_t:CDS:1 n=1 Tax=Ambispora gerdemannii TaxID=144530 RepID=A0A9N9AWJ4_9GLOM|nr:10961_t:CDS:10 [Ambispora gerdemannii]